MGQTLWTNISKVCWKCVLEAGKNVFDKIVEIPVEELMQQFALLPVLPFRDWEEDVFQDLTIVPLVLIPSTSVTASWSKSQSQRSGKKYEKVKICNISQSPRRQNRKKVNISNLHSISRASKKPKKSRKNCNQSCTCASASLDSWKTPHWPGSSEEGGTPEAGKYGTSLNYVTS